MGVYYGVKPLGVVVNGLQSYLDPVNVNSYPGSGTTVKDLVLTRSISTPSSLTDGATVVAGNFSMDGINDCVTIPSINLQTDFTITCWGNPTALTSPAFYMLGHGIAGTSGGALHVFVTTTAIEYRMWGGDISVAQTLSTGTWYNFAFTYSNTSPYTRKIYRNGSLLTSGSGLVYSSGSGNFRYGAIYGSGGTEFGKGSFGPIAIHSRVLTDSEITQNFNLLRGRFGI